MTLCLSYKHIESVKQILCLNMDSIFKISHYVYAHVAGPEQNCSVFGPSPHTGDAQPALYLRNVLCEAHTAGRESVQSSGGYFLAN